MPIHAFLFEGYTRYRGDKIWNETSADSNVAEFWKAFKKRCYPIVNRSLGVLLNFIIQVGQGR